MKTTITCKVKLFRLGVLLAVAVPVFVSCGEEDPVPELSVNPAAISVEMAGESPSITVTCNVEWTATANAEWIALSPASGTGNGTITVNVEANSTPETREATITVKADALTETVTIKQPGIIPTIEISETDIISAGIPAGSYPLAVTSNTNWTAVPDAEWITLEPASGTGNGTISINVEENTTLGLRTAQVTVTAGTLSRSVTIVQEGISLDVEEDETVTGDIAAEGGSFTLSVITNTAWNVESDAGWLAFDPTSGIGNDEITVNVAKNTTTEKRTATITIIALSAAYNAAPGTRAATGGIPSGALAKTITVTQEAATPGQQEVIEFTFTGNAVTFRATAENVVVDWGDGTPEEYTDLDYYQATPVSYTYTDNAAHTVRIQAATLSLFECFYQQLTTLDISNCATLTRLLCTGNQLSELDVSNNRALTLLECTGNQLSELDVSNNRALTMLFCGENQLRTLDVSNNMALTGLVCNINQLSELDVSNNRALGDLNCNGNPLSALDVSNNRALAGLICANNQLSELDVSNNTALVYLNCSSNQLSALDVSNNTALTTLNCYRNQLSALDVSNNTALTEFYCAENSLSALDVSNNRALIIFGCWGNQLSALDVSNNTALTYLECWGNQLIDTALNDLLRSLPDRSAMEAGRIYIGNNPGSFICDPGIAGAKNWIAYIN